jgi:hypothetical protein
MNAQVLRGPKQEIAESLARIRSEAREAIVFVAVPSDAADDLGAEIFAEMEPFAVSVRSAD